jgi:hypothetical protein
MYTAAVSPVAPVVDELRGEVTAFPSERVEEAVPAAADEPADDTAAV